MQNSKYLTVLEVIKSFKSSYYILKICKRDSIHYYSNIPSMSNRIFSLEITCCSDYKRYNKVYKLLYI